MESLGRLIRGEFSFFMVRQGTDTSFACISYVFDPASSPSDYTPFGIPIDPGLHTITFRYVRNDIALLPPGYTLGEAWIDRFTFIPNQSDTESDAIALEYLEGFGNLAFTFEPKDSSSGDPHSLVPNVISSIISVTGCVTTNPQWSVEEDLHSGVARNYFCPGSSANPPEFIVSSSDPSIVTGIRVYASTDAPQPGQNPNWDPTSFSIEGWSGVAWVAIASSDFSLDWVNRGVTGPMPARNTDGALISSSFNASDQALSFTEVTFENSESYTQYHVTFPTTRGRDLNPEASYVINLSQLELVGEVLGR